MQKDEIDVFLESLHLDKRHDENNPLTNQEIATIMLKQIKRYEEGEVSLNFVLLLANVLYQEVFADEYDETLVSLLCGLDDFNYKDLQNKREADKQIKEATLGFQKFLK